MDDILNLLQEHDWIIWFGLAAVVFLVTLAGMLVHVMQEKKRRQAVEAFSIREGFAFHGGPVRFDKKKKGEPEGMLEEEPPMTFPEALFLFSRGHSRSAPWVLQGRREGADIFVFDYTFTVGHGKNSSTYNQTVVRYRHGRLKLPAFSLRPENLFHRIGGLFGYQDIDFPGYQAFSSKYLLRGEDEEAIRELFRPELLNYFESEPGLCVDGAGEDLLVYRANKKIKVHDVPAFMIRSDEVVRLFLTG